MLKIFKSLINKDLTFSRSAAKRLHLLQINMTILTSFSNAHKGLISLHLHLNILLLVYQTGFLNFHLKWAAPIVFAKNGNSILCQNHAWQFCSLALFSNPTVSTSKCNQILNISKNILDILITSITCVCVHMHSVTQSCTIFWGPMDWSPAGSSVYDIFH